MRSWFLRITLVSLATGISSTAAAQTEKRVGLLVAYPATVGIHWQMADRLALRADGGFTFGTIEQTGPPLTFNGLTIAGSTTESHHHTTLIGLSALVTVSHRNQLRLYLAPRVAWNRTHTSFTTESIDVGFPPGVTRNPTTRTSESTNEGVSFDGMFGANYRLGDRFAVFGEAGVSWSHPTAATSVGGSTLKSRSVGSSSDLGIVLFF